MLGWLVKADAALVRWQGCCGLTTLSFWQVCRGGLHGLPASSLGKAQLKYTPVPHDQKTFLANARARMGFSEAYDAVQLECQVAGQMLQARSRAGLTQDAVAERMGTTKSAVSRSSQRASTLRDRPPVCDRRRPGQQAPRFTQDLLDADPVHCRNAVRAELPARATGLGISSQVGVEVVAGHGRRDVAAKDHHRRRAHRRRGMVQPAFGADVEAGCLQVGQHVAKAPRVDDAG